MSGMNGNSVSQCKSTNEIMKLLFYGLETLPVELLFSECAKIGGCTVDSWIPREVVPERFSGKYTLQLGPEGFTFCQSEDSRRLRFFLISSLTVWQDQMLLCLASNRRDTTTKYLVKALTPSAEQVLATSENGWCVLVEDESPNPRGARLVISRISGNKVFFHFDHPLRLSNSDTDSSAITEQLLHNACVAQLADLGQEFIIEKSSTPQSLGLSRPQNPKQYSDRLDVISQALCWGINYWERYMIKRCLSDAAAKNIIFLMAYGIFSYKQRQWVNRALHAFVHHAWVQTFHPTWSPNGRWKWFWKLSNYEPPIPFRTMMKYCCKFAFHGSLFTDSYSGMLMVTLY
ncbi:uncharacterized protein BDZ99DRAFT_523081 [Mytilinidion resinicola]|uniref:Uncharacterized protein n=1 Tax=Mytilinidion resinicola TaxID=574789 RepID=A0A6A6YFX0_9PEZI|nr:uncharacterized protein BDZ99DRAFT_523081 [Mytilinidion resinicola]KAF2807468.1 hypothetical protein BDZ99DRAFT_523081 [Mytilinidion resinicola]